MSLRLKFLKCVIASARDEFMGNFLGAFWRELSIIGLVGALYLTYSVYDLRLSNAELRLAVSKAEKVACQSALQDKTDETLEEARRAREATETAFKGLAEALRIIGERESQDLDDLMDVEVPVVEGCEDITRYLIDMSTRLRWSDQ